MLARTLLTRWENQKPWFPQGSKRLLPNHPCLEAESRPCSKLWFCHRSTECPPWSAVEGPRHCTEASRVRVGTRWTCRLDKPRDTRPGAWRELWSPKLNRSGIKGVALLSSFSLFDVVPTAIFVFPDVAGGLRICESGEWSLGSTKNEWRGHHNNIVWSNSVLMQDFPTTSYNRHWRIPTSYRINALSLNTTLPRDEKSFDRKGWIRGNTEIGPVFEVRTSSLQGKYGLEIGIDPNKDHFALVGQNFSWFQQIGHEIEQQRAKNFLIKVWRFFVENECTCFCKPITG